MEWPAQEANPEGLARKFGMGIRFELESRALDLQAAVQYADGYTWFQLTGLEIYGEGEAVNLSYDILSTKDSGRKWDTRPKRTVWGGAIHILIVTLFS